MGFDIETGDILWQRRLSTKITGWPISYRAGGRQYIAIVTGLDAHNWISTVSRDLMPDVVWPRGGNAGFVFALPEG